MEEYRTNFDKFIYNNWNYNIGHINKPNNNLEFYKPVTMPLNKWSKYVSEGKNVVELSGGVIPSGTEQTPGGLNGAVIKGNVNQGYGTVDSKYGISNTGLSWLD
jgi:hypothetical protein